MIPKNDYMMTINERKVFEKLQNTLNPKYVIFPQISIRSIIKRDFELYKNHKHYQTQWKIVDFLICEKPYFKPILAVEVNDETHEKIDRRERDSNVTVLLREMGIPIWLLKPEQDYKDPNEMDLNKHIEMMINKWLDK